MSRLIALLIIASFLLAACQSGTPVERPAATPTIPPTRMISAMDYGISSSTVFGMEDGFYSDAIQQFLEKQSSPLATYQEVVDQQTLTAAEIIWIVSQSDEYNLDPKALLTNLYIETNFTWPADKGEFFTHMLTMARNMAAAGKNFEQGGRTIRLGNGEILGVEDENSPAMFMVASYFSPSTLSVDAMKQLLSEWRGVYLTLFGEKAQKAPLSGIQANITPPEPFLRLPFNQPADYFFYINSFFDHDIPRNFSNSLIVRFDGRRMDNGSFSNCVLAITCYSGHNALDYGTPSYTPLYAAADGKVIYRYDTDGGLMIQHNNGYITLYWHMERIDVTLNQIVTQGQQIGVSGNRGQSTGPHLHFGLRRVSDSVDIDPYGWWSDTTDPWVGFWAWQGDLIADNREGQAQLFYNKYWYRDPNGYDGESWYTMTVTTTGSSTNWAIWGTYIYEPGTYTVSAYWPRTEYNTVEANYQIWSNKNVFTATVSQADDGDRFVPLGSFYLDVGPSVVILKDLTQIKSQRIYFDAIQWTPVGYTGGNLPYKIFIPWIQSDGQPCSGEDCNFP